MRFQPPPGFQAMYNPNLPYSGPIYGGLKVGMSLFIQGTVHNDANRFTINLKAGDDIAMHFNPRFGDLNHVVFNSCENGAWPSEEKPSEMPFSEGADFQLVFNVTSEGYQIKVNGSDLHLFKHRMPVEGVSALNIVEDVSVHIINIIGGGIGHIMGYPGSGQEVIIPYVAPMYGGLRPGMSLHIWGVVPCDATRFHISLQTAEAKCSDKALYINPRFKPAEYVVFSTFKNAILEDQERVTDSPFSPGENFQLVIVVTEESYEVKINDQAYTFKHRMPLARVLALGIGGDVIVESVNIIGEGQRAMTRPGPGYVGANSYTQPIPGGLKEGMSLYLRGTVPSEDINSFHINLKGGDDLALHFNPRFGGWRGVVFNTQDNGGWQADEKVNEMPFCKGKSFELVFFVTSEGYQVSVDGQEIHMYKHRVPLEQVTDMVIEGEVSVQTINIIPVPDEEVKAEKPEDEQGDIQECPAPGDVSSSTYSQSIDGGLVPGMSLYFEGTAHSDSNMFAINLKAGDDIAMHFNPRFGDLNHVVFNTCENGTWQSEEKPSEMPFSEGADFQLVFNVTSEGYQVIVNGSVLHMYKHRIPVDRVNSLSIHEDVSVRSIIINREQGLIQEYPAPGSVKNDTYEQPIEGGLKTGMMLYFRGTVPSENVYRFAINLEAGGDLAMHFNPRFDRWRIVVFNNRENGEWPSEERPNEMPFSEGSTFDLLFNVTLKGYQVIVDGRVLHMFKHRIPVDRVTALSIGGDVSIESLGIIKDSAGSGGSGYNWRFLPMMGTQPIFSPPVPYIRMIPGGMIPKKTIAISGRVLPDADWIAFNFNVSSSADAAFSFNPRMNEGSVVRNSRLGGNWGREERDVKFNPFQKGQYFEIMIRCGKLQFMVFGNGKHMFNYNHRFQPFTKIDTLHISGDVQLSYLLM